MQRLLARQIQRHLPAALAASPELAPFLDVLSQTYDEFHQNQAFAEHTLAVVSDELTEANQRLRAESESRLAELNRYYRQTLELQQGMILCYERRGDHFIHTLCLGRLALRLGWTPETVVGRRLEDFFPGEAAALLQSAYASAWSGQECQVEFASAAGSLSCIASLRPRFEGGVVREVIVSGEDVTELKRAQSEAQKLALVAARTDNAVVLTDASGRIEWVNAGFTRVTGYELAEVVGLKPGHFLQGPESDPETIRFMRDCLDRGEGFRTEIVNYSKFGRKYWLSIEVQPIHDESGRLTHFMAIESDVTERRQTDISLRVQLSLSRALAASPSLDEAGRAILSAIGSEVGWNLGLLWVLSPDGSALICAEHWPVEGCPAPELVEYCRALRLRPGQSLPGRAWETVAMDWCEELENVPDSRCAELARREGMHGAVAIPIRADGAVLGVVELLSTRAEAPDESRWRTFEALGAQIGQFYERMHAEEALRKRGEELLRANAELARASHHKTAFLAGMSHELRTPLNSILGLSESLVERLHGPLTEKQERYLCMVSESGRHLLALINDILDLAKIEAGEQKLECEPLCLAELCRDSLDLVAPMAQRRRQRIESEFSGAEARLFADSRRLKQILVNLLGNAVKFTPEGGRLGLRASVDADAIRIAVWDHGIGISAENIPRLFAPFQQIDSRLSRDYPGTGLGLSLVRQLAALHGGRVEVESRLGAGSTFTLVLPVARLLPARA